MASPRRRRVRRQVLEARRRGEAHPADPYAEALGLAAAPEEAAAPAPVKQAPAKPAKKSSKLKISKEK